MGKPLIPAQRRERIQTHLATHHIAATADLCEMLDVSEATIRRDLEWLEREGVVERTHGGAILSQRMYLEQEYNQRAQRHPEAKNRIGAKAASMIENGDIVFINSGTTTTQIIRHIPRDADITVITNNLIAVLEVGEVNYEIMLLGGSYQPRSNSTGGRFAINNLALVYANKIFVGVDGISMKYGCTVPSNSESEVLNHMMNRTHGPTIVVADCSKWGVVSNFEVASINQIQKFITDDGLDASARASLASRSVEVVIAD